MVFSSVVFIFCFLPATLILYYIAPSCIKNAVLLAASLFFYMWGQPEYLILLIISILLAWLTGILIEKADRSGRMLKKRIILAAGLLMNIGMLGLFKYADFIISVFSQASGRDIEPLGYALPIGISFFTFQGMSYIIDIYKGTCEACFNPLDTALYISLFPQLIAGPIIKYKDIQSMLKKRKHSIELFTDGLVRFVAGLSKKVLIANVLAETADNIFDSLSSGLDCPTAWLGIICYTLQIYFDFSGYSDMAIGLGKMFGFTFCENFNYPYISTSITEFWRRWHMSLSGWFRDYVYIPLGGNRKGIRQVNLFITFLVTGLWHGASFNFILWGVWYGLILIFEKPLLNSVIYKKIPSFFKWSVTILIVMAGWVLFRSPDLFSALSYTGIMFGKGALSPAEAHFSYMYYLSPKLLFTLTAAIVGCLPLWKDLAKQYKDTTAAMILRIPYVAILFVLCIIFIINNVYNPFIYFRF